MKYSYSYDRAGKPVNENLVCPLCNNEEFDMFCQNIIQTVPIPDSIKFNKPDTYKRKQEFGFECTNCRNVLYFRKMLNVRH